VLIEPLHLILIPAKIIQIALYFINIVLLSRNYKNIKWLKRPILNQLLIIALFGWMTYIFLDIFIFWMAAFSFENFAPLNEKLYFHGYNLDYPSLFWCNVLRDIAFAGLLIHLLAISFVPRIVLKGEAEFKQNVLTSKRITLTILLCLFIIYNDEISVTLYSNDIRIDTVWNGIALIVLFGVMIAYFIAASRIRYVFKKILREDEQSNVIIKKQCLYLSWGFFFVGFGYILMLAFGIIEGFNPEFIQNNRILLGYIGHIVWALSPIFIAQAFKTPNKPKLIE
jgi:hypothetical protein